jgi:hypothetical protein
MVFSDLQKVINYVGIFAEKQDSMNKTISDFMIRNSMNNWIV